MDEAEDKSVIQQDVFEFIWTYAIHGSGFYQPSGRLTLGIEHALFNTVSFSCFVYRSLSTCPPQQQKKTILVKPKKGTMWGIH
jgi:hypothetical protein